MKFINWVYIFNNKSKTPPVSPTAFIRYWRGEFAARNCVAVFVVVAVVVDAVGVATRIEY